MRNALQGGVCRSGRVSENNFAVIICDMDEV